MKPPALAGGVFYGKIISLTTNLSNAVKPTDFFIADVEREKWKSKLFHLRAEESKIRD